jgi:hypothetical protein
VIECHVCGAAVFDPILHRRYHVEDETVRDEMVRVLRPLVDDLERRAREAASSEP